MTEEKQIKQVGVFWGNEALYLVESANTVSKKIFRFPFGEAEKIAIKNGPLSTAGLELSYRIKEALKKNHFEDCPVNVSLPTRDIIFRSFVIPWMQQSEIKSVVEFEVSKYIPFSLEKLSSSYHAITFTEHTTRRIRIIFVAIKNDILGNYIKFLSDAALHITAIEPAASSLIRTLGSKNLIPSDQTVALIECHENIGRIIIIDNDVPQFVREFQLSVTAPTKDPEDPQEMKAETLIKKITGEIRISLDYFNRQNSQLQVKQTLLISTSQPEEISEALKQTLSIPATTIDHESILNNTPKEEFGFLNAYGASIIAPVNPVLYFNFADKRVGGKEKTKEPQPKKPFSYKSLIKTSLVCIPLIISSIIVSGFLTQKQKKTIASMTEQLGSYQDADVSSIEESKTSLENKLAYFKKLRLDSDVAHFLLLLPGLLPEGAWIENLKISYDDSASFEYSSDAPKKEEKKKGAAADKANAASTILITIDGYVYSENQNRQFQLVNKLLKNLKANENFSTVFNKIDLATTQTKTIDEYSVTAFTVICKQNNEPQRPK
jgi:Tfp pilus assembly PilM family ATPase